MPALLAMWHKAAPGHFCVNLLRTETLVLKPIILSCMQSVIEDKTGAIGIRCGGRDFRLMGSRIINVLGLGCTVGL